MAVAFDMAFDVQTKLNTATYGCTVAFDMVSGINTKSNSATYGCGF